MEDRIAHYMVTFTPQQWPEAYRRALEVEELPRKGSRRVAAAVTAAATRPIPHLSTQVDRPLVMCPPRCILLS